LKSVFIILFSEFLAASGWEGDIQLHLEEPSNQYMIHYT
jgi:hypothetical protein